MIGLSNEEIKQISPYENVNSNKNSKKQTNDSSSCSSRSSNTDNSSDSQNSNSESESSDETSESSNEENIFININKFPVQLIILENCNNTFDDYILNNKIRDDEWDSIILQILF